MKCIKMVYTELCDQYITVVGTANGQSDSCPTFGTNQGSISRSREESFLISKLLHNAGVTLLHGITATTCPV